MQEAFLNARSAARRARQVVVSACTGTATIRDTIFASFSAVGSCVHQGIARLDFSAIIVANLENDVPVISPGLATEFGPPVTISDVTKRGERQGRSPGLGNNSGTLLVIGATEVLYVACH
jgi:hypothetical protein